MEESIGTENLVKRLLRKMIALKNIVYCKKHELGNAKDYTMDNKIHIQQSRENQM